MQMGLCWHHAMASPYVMMHPSLVCNPLINLLLFVDNMPQCVWIWDICNIQPTVLIVQLKPVKQFLWNPIDPDQLAICSGSNTLCFWSAHEMDVCHVEVPNSKYSFHIYKYSLQINLTAQMIYSAIFFTATFSVNNIRWRPDGKSLLIMDKNMFSTANFQCEEDEAGEQDLVSN